MTVVELLHVLDSLAVVDIKKVWETSLLDTLKRVTTQVPLRSRVYTYNDFEAHNSVESKVKLVAQQLEHVLHEDADEQCESYRCCSLLESPTLLDTITAITSAVLLGLHNTDILPDVIAGLSIHCALNSRLLIERLVLNFPEKWYDIYECLLGRISILKGNSDHKGSARCLAVLHHLSTFVPDMNGLLNKCIQLRQLPSLVIQLAIKQSNTGENFSLINFFKRVLLDQGRKTQSWFGEYLKSAWETNPTLIADVNEKILSAISGILDDSKAVLPKEQLLPALEFLRTIAALCGHTGFVLSSKLRSFVLHLITHPTGRSEKAVNFICFCLAFIIGLRSCLFDNSVGLNEASSGETEEQLVVWLRRLISRQDIFHTSLRQSSSYSEVLLLFGLLFNDSHPTTIRDIIVNTLDIDAPCFVRNISASRKLFAQKVFTCQSIAAQAAHVPVTACLNAHITGNLPIHCVFQLLKNHAFNKNRVQIKGWIYRQICASVRPLHPLMLELLEIYVTNALTQTVGLASSQMIGACGGCVPFTEAELFVQFSDPAFGPDARMCAPGATGFVTDLAIDSVADAVQMDLTPQLLFLYYMLYIYDQELSSRSTDNRGNQRSQAKASLSQFSDKLWDAIPITYLLQYARSNLSSYRQLYPRLLQLVTEHRPHLTVGELTIQDELLLDPLWKSASSFQSFNSFCAAGHFATPTKAPLPNELLSVLDQILTPGASLDSLKSAAAACIRAVNALVETVNRQRGFSRLRHLLPYAEAIGCRLPRILLETAALSGNRRFTSAVCFLWRSLHCLMPRRLEVLTVKALSSKKETYSRLTHHDLLKDPVENIVMAVDQRVYRCPPVLTLLIRIIDCNLRASRAFWWHRVISRHFIGLTSTIASEKRETLTTASATPLPLVPITGDMEMQGFARGRRTGGNGRSTLEPASGSGIIGESSAASSSQPNALEPLASDDLCDRLRTTLVTCQDATVVQLLLEFCLPTAEEKRLNSEVTDLREVQNIICAFIHFLFIGDPNLAKVVFWQTYPRSLNPLATRAIPSIQVCADTVLEVFVKSGSLEDVVFCLDFVSHLALHCTFTSMLNLATYAVEVMHFIFTHLASLEEMASLLIACGPAFCRLGSAFPSIGHRLAAILLSAMAALAEAVTLAGGSRHRDILVRRIVTLKSVVLSDLNDASLKSLDLVKGDADSLPRLHHLTRTEKCFFACVQAMFWFNQLVRLTTAQRRLSLPPSIEELPSLLTCQSFSSLYSSYHSEK
ncbi:Integrator complex subunit 2 [Echinococcus granulosus]|nr:Integrator complex subunit 2 [Echinococcus granulosus]